MYMRAFAEAWPDLEIIQQRVGRLPWRYNHTIPGHFTNVGKLVELRVPYSCVGTHTVLTVGLVCIPTRNMGKR